jgi:rubrerythrin
MTGYSCTNCGYRLESEKIIKKCPYCDRTSIAKDKTAEELLDSIEE